MQDPDIGTVLIVDDDSGIRGKLESLLCSVGLTPRAFSGAHALLESTLPDCPSCLISDVRMPRIGGLELLDQLRTRGDVIPVVFMSEYADVTTTVRAMKAGAVDFLAKPFRDHEVLDAVNEALNHDRRRRYQEDHKGAELERYERLTPREREVMEGIVRGLMNKQIAWELGITETTVKLHRSSLMKKTGMRNVPDLVRLAQLVALTDAIQMA